MIVLNIFAVNLIPNPSFENWSDLYHCDSWIYDSSSVFYIVKDSIHVFDGNYSIKANIFTQTQASTDIISDTFAVIPGDSYQFSYRFYDNDSSANGRYYFYHFDASKNYLSNYYGSYTSDNPAWQTISGTYTVPAGTYYMFAGFRFYDVSGWDGDAVIYLDSVFFGNSSGSSGNSPPQFSSHLRVPLNPVVSETVYPSIIITDDSGIFSDSMYYSVNSGTFIPVYHDSINTGRYYFTIPNQILNTDIDYFFSAMDDSSAIAYSDTFSYTVADNGGVGLRILFDFTKEEDAGNADWIIDTNYPKPLPDNPNAENDWLGAISHWGFELDSSGYVCRTLPPGFTITYGNADSMDLQNYDVFIMPEPQNPLTASEKSAIFDFVRDGGGLFMVADHNASDRNSNGWDSPHIFNDLGSPDSFGMYFNVTGDSYNSISDICNSFTGLDSIYNGKYGNAQGSDFAFHAGTTMPASADAIEIAPHPDNSSYSMLSVCYFGNGKVAGMGDSSPADDGTGQAGNTLYDGWNEGISKVLIMNTTWWLSVKKGLTGIDESFISYSYAGENITITVRNNSENAFAMLRLYKKEQGAMDYKYIESVKYGTNVIFNDHINSNSSVYYKITGINHSGQEIFIGMFKSDNHRNIELIDNIITDNILRFNNNNKIEYQIFDFSGRIVQSGTGAEGIVHLNLNPGIYIIKSANYKGKITVIE